MSETNYEVYMDGKLRASHLSMETATLLCKALISEYTSGNFDLTIKKMEKDNDL